MNPCIVPFTLLLFTGCGQKSKALGAQPPAPCSLATPRLRGHSATVLANGAVLVVGGLVAGGKATAEAELIDPSSGRVRTVGRMTQPRAWHTATLLPQGTVLIAGGAPRNASTIASATAEIYDPATGAFTPTPAMGAARHTHTATLLQDGTVLIAGGDGAHPDQVESSCEFFDPARNTFNPLPSQMTTARTQHTATLLESGQVLIAGGTNWMTGPCASAEVYDPATHTFEKLGADPPVPPQGAGALRLRSGKVLLVGPKGVELFDPETRSFLAAPGPLHHRRGGALTALPGGGAALIGGEPYPPDPPEGPLASVEIFHENPGGFREGLPLPEPRAGLLAVTLNDGRILIVGGTNGSRAPSRRIETFKAP